ncbi:hypothetical protein Areg01_29480 [Actinoplanes regularis]|nr:hypothetical protein Areg01_29480 [Actinoplanes regularis]
MLPELAPAFPVAPLWFVAALLMPVLTANAVPARAAAASPIAILRLRPVSPLPGRRYALLRDLLMPVFTWLVFERTGFVP